MRLVDELKQQLGAEESPFRAQLLREDLARIERLVQLARSTADVDAYREAGRRLGWTQGDSRTAEIAAALDPFLDAVFDHASQRPDALLEERVRGAWIELYRMRLERLTGCLSTRVPRLEG